MGGDWASDLGENDTQFSVLSHLGNVLKPGDSVLGYDLTTANINDDNVEEMQRKGGVSLPDIIRQEALPSLAIKA